MDSILMWICIIATLGLEVDSGQVKDLPIATSICSGKNGVLVPMLDSCSGFFFCIDGNAIASSCGNFYQFNSRLGICDHPTNVQCKANASDASTSFALSHVSSDFEAMFVCARSAPEGYVFAKSNSCNLFYACRQGVAIRRICPPQWHFNAKEKICQDAGEIECLYAIKPQTTTKAPLKPSAPRNPLYAKKPLQVNFSLTSVCSNVKANTAVAHPWNCEQFVYCLKNKPVVLSCSKHLHFNGRTQKCELPSSAECKVKLQ